MITLIYPFFNRHPDIENVEVIKNVPRSNSFIASLMKGTSSRLTTNPGVSLHVIGILPIDLPHSIHFLYVSSEVAGVRTI